MSVFEEFLNLILPTTCVLCDALGSSVCDDCNGKISNAPIAISRFDFPGYRICTYTSGAAKLVHEFKEANQTSIASVFANAILPAMNNFELTAVALIPIPSKKKSFAARGFNPANEIAKSLSRKIAAQQNLLIPVCNILQLHRQVADQASLTGESRRTNLVGAMSLTKSPPDRGIILLDDVVTTGATMREARRCLEEAGAKVIGFLAFAETLPKNKQNGHKESF